MNRQERRAAGKGQDDQRMDITGIVIHFANGQYVNLDTSKVTVVDKDTMRPIFEEVLEPVARQLTAANDPNAYDQDMVNTPSKEFPEDDTQKYTVRFDTPEGPMEYVKDGNWSGVRKAR